METFSQGNPVSVVDSPLNFAESEVVKRAENRIGERGYDLFENNCEHFVLWCRTGVPSSSQIEMTETVARQATAIAAKPLLKKVAQRAIARRMGTAAAGVAVVPTMVAGVADAVQATAEIVATQKGKTKEEARGVGQQAGVASSVALGWVVGGPVVAAAGVGIWVIGQLIADKAVDHGKQMVTSVVNRPS
jgi:hypothetical protein